MIRINLAKNRGAPIKSADASQMVTVDASEMASVQKTALVRLFVILLGPLGLFMYQEMNLPEKVRELNKMNLELTQISDKNQKAKDSVAQMKRFKKEQEVLQAQISAIESLKKDRLREVRVLDFVQKDIPEKMWLTRMELNDGKLSIQGLATTDSELSIFMDNLSRNAYLKEVSLVRSTDFNSNEYGALKRFEISCLMEKTL